MICEPRTIPRDDVVRLHLVPSSTASRYSSRKLKSGVMLPGVDPVAKEARKDHQEGARQLERLRGDPGHHSQPLFGCTKANQALDEKGPPQQCQGKRYPRPYVMKPNDEGPKGVD